MGRHLYTAFMKQHFMYKLLVVLIVIVVIFTLSSWTAIGDNPKKCFLNSISNAFDILFLEDILHSERKPQLGQSIFFHETSCSSNGLIRLNARQACAIESAAKLNPTWDVFLLFASPVGFLNNSIVDPIIGALQFYPNIFMRNVNLWTYPMDTPAEQWIQQDKLFRSSYINSHASDFLRYLSLYKWGGTYLDLDIILKRSLNDIHSNYAGAESNEFVAAGVINFDANDVGHEIADLCLREFMATFDGRQWGNNGPGVITRVLHDVCKTKYPTLMTRERCHGFKVFPINAFYAIGWQNWAYFFDERYSHRTLQLTNDSIAIHVWNKHSSQQSIRVGSKVAYALLAEKYCPEVYRSCGKLF